MKRLVLSLVVLSSVFVACQSTDKAQNKTNASTEPISAAIEEIKPNTPIQASAFELFLKAFKKAVHENDSKLISDLCEFPFESGTKQSELIEGFEYIFDTHVRAEIAKLTLEDWQLNSQGKKQVVLNIDWTAEAQEDANQIIFITDKKGEVYKLVDIIIGG